MPVSLFYTLHDRYGNPPQPGGGAYVGNAQSTVESMLRLLATTYGPRINTLHIRADVKGREVKALIAELWGNTRIDATLSPP